jgi:Domain of unknown function (DUF4166)
MSLFVSVLGADFDLLEPELKWVHGGESRRLRGSVSVRRGSSLLSRLLGILAWLPPPMKDAPIELTIVVERDAERWERVFARTHRMVSTLKMRDGLLVERLGLASLTFKLRVRPSGLDWNLQRISVAGIPLPVGWFFVCAAIDVKGGRYHFSIDSVLRGAGGIVSYVGSLDAPG